MMPSNGAEQDQSDAEDRFNQELMATADRLLRHVVPLFSIRPGKRPVLVGSSLLVEREQTSYLASARHVIDHTNDPGGLHYDTKLGQLHRLRGNILRTQPYPGLLDTDHYDIGIVQLPADEEPAGAEALKVPLPFSSLCPLQLPRQEKQYLVTGFPSSGSHANPQSVRVVYKPACFRLVSSSDSTAYTALDLAEAHHIVFDVDIGRMYFPDGSLRRVAHPRGMSGSPVWLLGDEGGNNESTIASVAGIFIEYHLTKKLLVATDIAVAIHLIDEAQRDPSQLGETQHAG